MTNTISSPFLELPDAKIFLASKSVARQRILRAAGIEFDVVSVTVDEAHVRADAISDAMMVDDIAVLLAFLKAQAASQIIAHSNLSKNTSYIIGCDQILILDDKIMTKPKTKADAKNQLSRLAGRKHELLSAIVLFHDGHRIWHHLARASMTMRQFDDDFVSAYIHYIDKAAFCSPGAYQIESVGASLFTEIKGDYFDVLGLPLFPLLAILNEHGLRPIKSAR